MTVDVVYHVDMTTATQQATAKTTRTATQFWAWKYDATGYNKTSAGPVWGLDAYDAGTQARRVWGAGRYQIREVSMTGRILVRFA